MRLINNFRGHYRFLSNFWYSPVHLDGVEYPSVEHAFQAAKTLDLELREEIRASSSSRAAKRLGRNLRSLRPGWDEMRSQIMLDLVRDKFLDPELREKLQDTKNAHLEEGNTWHDNFWGNCYCAKCCSKNHPVNNQLGIILMMVRDETWRE